MVWAATLDQEQLVRAGANQCKVQVVEQNSNAAYRQSRQRTEPAPSLVRTGRAHRDRYQSRKAIVRAHDTVDATGR